MTSFEDWLNEIEVFSSRYERAVGDVYHGGGKDLKEWLEAAYEVGFKTGKEDKEYDV